MNIPLPPALSIIASHLPSLYMVGGYVRNALLFGVSRGTDYDICGSQTPDEVRALLADTPIKVIDVNPRIGTLQLTADGISFEYTTFRRDSYPLSGEHAPSEVTFVRTLAEDAQRRDFTVNALYVDAHTGELIDPLGGVADLNKRLLRTTRDARLVFAEDGLRILRLVRFSAELGFDVEEETWRKVRMLTGQLFYITAPRISAELSAILFADTKYGVAGGHVKGLRLVDELALWPYIVPTAPVHDFASLLDAPATEGVRYALLFSALGLDTTQINGMVSTYGKLIYSRKLVQGILDVLAGVEDTQPDPAWWVIRHQVAIPDILCYLRAVGQTQRADETHSYMLALRQANVSLDYKHYPVTPDELRAMGVPPAHIGTALQTMIVQGMHLMRTPTRAECVEAVELFRRTL